MRLTPDDDPPSCWINVFGSRLPSSFWRTAVPIEIPHTPAKERPKAKNANAWAFSVTGSGASTGKYNVAVWVSARYQTQVRRRCSQPRIPDEVPRRNIAPIGRPIGELVCTVAKIAIPAMNTTQANHICGRYHLVIVTLIPAKTTTGATVML